jgi:macrolide-specific efflux system membrane fusion protein
MQASSPITVDAAIAAAEVAKAEHQANIDIEKKRPNTVSKSEFRKTELNEVHSVMKIKVAELEREMAKVTADAEAMAEEAADEEIARRRLLSPIGGVVDRVLAQVGEWVQPGQPIVEVVRLDKLRLETSLDPYDVSPREIVGRQVEIEVPVGGGQVEKFTGKIGFVSPVVIADRYRATVDFDNRKVDNFWAVTPGLQATMKIKLLPAGRQLSGAPVSKSAP